MHYYSRMSWATYKKEIEIIIILTTAFMEPGNLSEINYYRQSLMSIFLVKMKVTDIHNVSDMLFQCSAGPNKNWIGLISGIM